MNRGRDAGSAVFPELRPAGEPLIGADLQKRIDLPAAIDMKVLELRNLHSPPRLRRLSSCTLAHNSSGQGRGGEVTRERSHCFCEPCALPWAARLDTPEEAMNSHRRLQILLAVPAALLSALLLGAASTLPGGSTALAQTPQAAPALSDIASYEGPDREKRLIEGAKKEGELMFYSSIPVEDIAALTAAFDKKYGVKVKVWRADSEGFLQRIVNETKERRFEVDVMAGSSSALEPLYRERLLQAVKSPHLNDLIPESIAKHREWASVYLNTFVQAFNTNLVPKEGLPTTYQDLLKPQWRGKLAIEAEDYDWFAQVVLGLGEAQGLKLFRDIVANNGLSDRKGHTLR